MTKQEAWNRYEANLFSDDMEINDLLNRGIEQGLPFDGYKQITHCPESLRERYNELEAQAKAAEMRKRNLFLEGFLGEDGSYIPRETHR